MRDSTKRSLEDTLSLQNSSSSASICRSNEIKGQSETYEKLLTLDSAFYQPNRWQSKYVRKLTTTLSIKDSRRRMLTRESEDNSMILQTQNGNLFNGSGSLTIPQCCQCQCRTSTVTRLQDTSRRARPTTMYFANDCVRTSTNTNPLNFEAFTRNSQLQNQNLSRTNSFINEQKTDNRMSIQAAHQFSTIKTIYNDDRRTYEGIVQPHKPMLVQVDFEVSGDVSGVYFMKYAKSMCDTLDIRGWIRVSPRGSVYGQLQGEKTKVDEITLWLRSQGSPKSKVAGCEFRNWHLIDSCNFRSFTIRY